MNAVVILFLIGILLLAGEVFVPGAILGILGGLAMLGGSIIAFQLYGVGGGMVATIAAAALLGAMLFCEFYLLPRTQLGKKLFVQSTVASTSQPPLAEAANIVGQTGEAITPLVPSGYVRIEGRRYEAFSRDGHLAQGTTVRVASLDNFRLIVTKS